MEALVVLFLLPVLIGLGFGLLLRDTTKASLAATLSSPLVVYICLMTLDPDDTWNWLATLLVSPLVIAFALATILIRFGRSHMRKRSHENHISTIG
jgi:hypothetical protein